MDECRKNDAINWYHFGLFGWITDLFLLKAPVSSGQKSDLPYSMSISKILD